LRQQFLGLMPDLDFAFRDTGLDRAEPSRNNAARLDAAWPKAQVLVLNERGEACVWQAENQYLPACEISLHRPDSVTLLGFENDRAYFALPLHALSHLPMATVGIRSAALHWSARDAAIFAQAKAILHWQAQSLYCGRCGSLLSLKTAGYSAACMACGLVSYPPSHPAAIMTVSDGEHILLGRQAAWPERRYSLLAGFVEPGESPEQTVVREVFEESGVRVQAVRYVCAQPWPMPMALMLGFEARADVQSVILSDELQDARWFSRAELQAKIHTGEVLLSDRVSISHALIQRWLSSETKHDDFWHTTG
jgi:NAD+ diphosphatase